MNKQDVRDWFIMLHVGAAVNLIIFLMFKHPDPVTIGAGCTAVPTLLGLYHWFTQRDDKIPDNGRKDS